MHNEENTFSYKVGKENKTFIYWHDLCIKILSGDTGIRFQKRMEGLDPEGQQKWMARETANLKRKRDGNTETIVIRGVHHTREV